jgi:hypothetical protein
VTDDTLGVMNRWVVLLALLGACVIDEHTFFQQAVSLDDANDPVEGFGSDAGAIHDTSVHEGGLDSGSGSSGSGSDGSSGSGSDGSGSTGSGSGSGSGIGSGSSGSDSGSGSGSDHSGGDDAGLTDINNDSDARTNFYSCAGCGTSNPSQAGVLAFGVILVIRRRRR